MIKKLFPLILLIVGAGAGVGAGLVLRPAPAAQAAVAEENAPGSEAETAAKAGEKEDQGSDYASDASGETEFVKMNNQFVIPIVANEKVAALVVMGLSVEVPVGETDAIYRREPKLRDSFLQVLFDHANIGGFDGAFTDAQMLGRLREALRDVARRDIGTDTVQDVLIIEIARQDY